MAAILKRKTKDGHRYDVSYRGPDGRERSKTWRTRKDAERFKSTVEADMLRGAWVDPKQSARTFDDLATEWLKSNPGKRSSSYARDESVIRVHLSPEIGLKPIVSITPADIRRLVFAWSDTRAPRTVRRNYGVLRAILAFAVDSESLVASPCRGIKLPAAAPLVRHIITPDELARLTDEVGPEYGAMVYLGVALGLRWAECAGLRVGHVDFLNRRLTVAEQVTRGYKGVRSIGPPKSDAGRRTLTVPVPVMDALSVVLASRGLTAADGDSLIFVDSIGGALRYEHWRRRVWLPAVERAGLGDLQFHDLRRANATAMVSEGIDLKTAQVRMGHSDPRLTLAVYAMASTEAERDAGDAIGDRFFNRPRATGVIESA